MLILYRQSQVLGRSHTSLTSLGVPKIVGWILYAAYFTWTLKAHISMLFYTFPSSLNMVYNFSFIEMFSKSLIVEWLIMIRYMIINV